jgi:hypothetical protein
MHGPRRKSALRSVQVCFVIGPELKHASLRKRSYSTGSRSDRSKHSTASHRSFCSELAMQVEMWDPVATAPGSVNILSKLSHLLNCDGLGGVDSPSGRYLAPQARQFIDGLKQQRTQLIH